MIEPRLIRDDFEKVKANLEKRQDPEVIKKLESWVEKDNAWRAIKIEVDDLRQERNKVTEEIKMAKGQGKDVAELMAKAKEIPGKLKEKETQMKELEEGNKPLLMSIPNMLLDDVPYGEDEEGNVEFKKVGEPTKLDFEPKHHGQLASEVGGAEFERAVKIAGEGFYALKGDLALLNMAIVNYGINLLAAKGFKLVIPPGMINRTAYEGVTDLADFETVMYKIDGQDHYLIATAEHPLTAMHMGEILEDKDLPILYMGYSMNYRKEIGSHGIDERGLFRLHQFDKVEQIVICKPEESQKWHEELLKNAEQLVQDFELPYHVINICTGDIGTVAAKKYDLECWSTRENKYFETHSLSNCTSYQSVRLNIKYRKNDGTKEFVHTLNATEVAIPRMLRAIIENHQTKDGTIKIPKLLQPYMGGKTEIKAE